MQVNLEKFVKEIYNHYPETVEALIDYLWHRRTRENLIGENTDETLTRVYKQKGYYEALQDILNKFKNN